MMTIGMQRNTYAYGVDRNVRISVGGLSTQGSNSRRLDENGYHHSNQVAVQTMGQNWAAMLGASTETTVAPAGQTWTHQWLA